MFWKAIIYILAAYFIIRFIARLAMPHVVKKVMSQAEEQMRQREQAEHKKEGEITVQVKQNPTQKYNADEGEYVDFEEIKEK